MSQLRSVPSLNNSPTLTYSQLCGRLHGLTGSAVGHRSIAPGFKSRPCYIRRAFLLNLRLIIFGGRSAHLPYLLYKGGLKTATRCQLCVDFYMMRFVYAVDHLFGTRCRLLPLTRVVLNSTVTNIWSVKGRRAHQITRQCSAQKENDSPNTPGSSSLIITNAENDIVVIRSSGMR